MCAQVYRAVERRTIGCDKQAQQILNASLMGIEIERNRFPLLSTYGALSEQRSAQKVRLCGLNDNISVRAIDDGVVFGP